MEIKRTQTVIFDEREVELLVSLMDYIDHCMSHLGHGETSERMLLKCRIQQNLGQGDRDVSGSLIPAFDPNDEIPF